MRAGTKTKTADSNQVSLWDDFFIPNHERMIEWLGGVNYENLQSTMSKMKALLETDSTSEIHLMVNSYGGPTGIAMSFYDAARSWLRPHLVTIGSGYVDSSGIIVFLSGSKRYITKNTTLLFHLAGRTFESNKRYSTLDMENMLKEDKLKDYQYACIVSDATRGKFNPEKILEMMRNNTVLTSEEALNMGLAHKVLD
jgi:ATP-dependent Clp protease, protease subunit